MLAYGSVFYYCGYTFRVRFRVLALWVMFLGLCLCFSCWGRVKVPYYD